MILLLDHLNALIIGAAAFLMFLGLQARMNETSVEQTANYVMKNQASNLAVWLEDDLLRMGDNMGDEVAFSNPVDSAGLTTEFTFQWDSVNTAVVPFDTTRYAVRYRLHRTGMRVGGSDTLSTYRIARSVRLHGGSWMLDGASSSLVSSFRVDMLNADARPVDSPAVYEASNPDSVRNTRIRFAMATPFETKRSTIRQVYYGSTLMIRR